MWWMEWVSVENVPDEAAIGEAMGKIFGSGNKSEIHSDALDFSPPPEIECTRVHSARQNCAERNLMITSIFEFVVRSLSHNAFALCPDRIPSLVFRQLPLDLTYEHYPRSRVWTRHTSFAVCWYVFLSFSS